MFPCKRFRLKPCLLFHICLDVISLMTWVFSDKSNSHVSLYFSWICGQKCWGNAFRRSQYRGLKYNSKTRNRNTWNFQNCFFLFKICLKNNKIRFPFHHYLRLRCCHYNALFWWITIIIINVINKLFFSTVPISLAGVFSSIVLTNFYSSSFELCIEKF